MQMTSLIEKAAQIINESSALVLTAGAGMGVDSGLPDFRGRRGFWKAYPIAEKLGLSFTDLANPRHFETNPKLAWAFYGHRLNLYRATRPHSGFAELLRLAQNKPDGYFIFTSNVDGQFQTAGFDSRRIVECHGSIHHLQCSEPCGDHIWSAEGCDISIEEEAFKAVEPLPCCPRCGALARPNILMFGDYGWSADLTVAQERRFERWRHDRIQANTRVAIIECGAGTSIPTVRHFSEKLARSGNAKLIRINPEECDVPTGHIGIPTGAQQGIQKLVELLQ